MVIYVGGILVLLLFGVMLTHKLYSLDLKSDTFQFCPALLLVARGVHHPDWRDDANHVGRPRRDERPNPTTAQIGELFMKEYILPFEVASIFLLVALIGAAMIVRRRQE